MRYTFIEHVQQGELLGKNIYASDGRVLLQEGVQLTVALLSKLRRMGVHYIYIKDDRLEDVKIEEVVSDKTKREVVSTLTTSFQVVQSGRQIDTKAINQSVSKILEEILANQNILISLTDIRTEDNRLFIHSINVCIIAVVVGLKIGLDKTKLHEIAVGALLHDIGKIIPNDDNAVVSEKDGDTNDHTWKGFNTLRKNADISTLSAHIALTHHENVDGSGYPRKMEDKDIHILSKIVAVANYYDNLVAPSNGGKGLFPHEACERIMGLTNVRFSHPVVWRFLRAIAFYPTGSQVRLSTGETGVVVGQHHGLPQRPIIRVYSMYGRDMDDYEIKEIDLAKETTIFINEIIS